MATKGFFSIFSNNFHAYGTNYKEQNVTLTPAIIIEKK
jgi:hypothetical protein